MKSILTLAILAMMSIAVIPSFAQKKIKSPDLKIGVSYPYVFGNIEKIGSNVNETNKITGFPTISVEKPFPIEHKRKNKFSINPGVAYYYFKEDEAWGFNDDGGWDDGAVGRDFKLNHHTVNGYSKFLYQAKFQGRSTGFVYFGGILGFHLITKTTGTKILYSKNPDSAKQIIEVHVNENAKDFYGMIYYGALVGMQPNSKITNVIKPSFEAKFFPGLVNRSVIKNSTSTFENEMVAEISIFLGLRLD